MTLKTENAAYEYLGAFVDELARSGVRHLCLCPGSRSTPLALMFADHPKFKIWLHLDERSAAFFALGLAKAQQHPVALLCTSGTAAANFFPAIIEAHYARVPLIVLTADRPPELREAGAPQTIDQIKLYGSYAKWFVEMALPEATPEMLRYVRTIACRAAAESTVAPSGVVHLNFPFREPLVPIPAEVQWLDPDREAFTGRAKAYPYLNLASTVHLPDSETVSSLGMVLPTLKRGLIVAGPQTDARFPGAAARLSAALGYPILADPLSQVRCGEHDRRNVIASYDAFLRDTAAVEQLAPEVILRFGALPTSKPALLYLQHHTACQQILIDSAGGWADPVRLATHVIHAEAAHFCAALADYVERNEQGEAADSGWCDRWRALDRRTRLVVETQLQGSDELFEGRVFAELAACLPDGATLWASSSMPVRDLDTFFPSGERSIRFLANRGANGIDGVLSSALGASAVASGPLVAVVGDIAFYHDLNGLLAAKLHHLNATIVLLNNNGGGIFSFLPQAAHPKHFEQLFGTPHGLDFRPAAELYGATFERVTHWAGFRSAVKAGLESTGLSIVEVQTERGRNVTLHRAIWPAVSAGVREVLNAG